MENSFQTRFDEIIRIANMLYPMPDKCTMKIIKCSGCCKESTFDLRVLNENLLYRKKEHDI